MDTVSQAALGVFTTDTLCRRALGPKNIAIGLAAGVLPDLDVMLPLLVELSGGNFYLTYLATHRTWSHSLVVAPILALLLGSLVHRLPALHRRKVSSIVLAAWLAMVTHILLDLCTSYGIELFWPISRSRFALYWIPEVDLFLLPLLVILLAFIVLRNLRRRESGGLSRMGLAIFVVYCLAGGVLHQVMYHRATLLQARMTGANDGKLDYRFGVFPQLGSLLVWRAVCISDEKIAVARYDLGRAEPTQLMQAANAERALPEWLGRGPELATVRHATSSFVGVRQDSACGSGSRFLLQDLRFALSPADSNGLIVISAWKDSVGLVHCDAVSWFLGKTFLRGQSYAHATAELWHHIFTP